MQVSRLYSPFQRLCFRSGRESCWMERRRAMDEGALPYHSSIKTVQSAAPRRPNSVPSFPPHRTPFQIAYCKWSALPRDGLPRGQAQSLKPYLDNVRHELERAMCLDFFPSPVVERHTKPEVEVQ